MVELLAESFCSGKDFPSENVAKAAQTIGYELLCAGAPMVAVSYY